MPNLFLLTLKVHQTIYERTGGLLGHRLLGRPTLLLHTRGRRTGQPRTSALLYAEDGDDLLVIATNGGHHKPPAWLLNLEADPELVAQVGVRKHAVKAVSPSGATRTLAITIESGKVAPTRRIEW